MRKVQCSLSVICRYILHWSWTDVSNNESEIHALTIDMLPSFYLAIAIIYARLFIHSKTLSLEWGMKWMSRMWLSWMISILILKGVSGTTIGFLDGNRLENISLFCADVKKICTFQQRGGLLLVLLHNRLAPRTSSMQSQLTTNFSTASNCLKEVV